MSTRPPRSTRWVAWLAATLLGALLSGCGRSNYLVPSGGASTARGFQQAAQVRWNTAQFNLERMAYDEEQAILKDPGWAVPHARLAQVFLALNEPQQALAEAKTAAQLAPRDETDQNNLGQMALSLKQWPLARQAFTKALSLNAADWVADTGLAFWAIHFHQWSNASALLRKAVVAGGPEGLTYDAWGQLFQDQGNLSEAAGYYQDAVNTNPGWWRGYYDLAQVDIKLGERTSALANLQEALALSPQSGPAWELYQSLKPTPNAPGTWTP